MRVPGRTCAAGTVRDGVEKIPGNVLSVSRKAKSLSLSWLVRTVHRQAFLLYENVLKVISYDVE